MPAALIMIVVWLTCIAAAAVPYITHIVWCIQNAERTGSAIALLIVGVVAAPIGWVHGLCVLLGWTWI